MRPLFALLCSTSILGGLYYYMSTRPAPKAYRPEPLVEVSGHFSVEILRTFDAAPDPFAADPNNAPSLIVLFHGSPILQRSDAVSATEPIVIDNVSGVIAGENEFYVEAYPDDTEPIPHAVRLRILRNQIEIADSTIWSELGEPVAGTIVVEVPQDEPTPRNLHSSTSNGI